VKLNNLIKVGSNRSTKRRGRGQGSGCGGTSGRGHKGGKARSGYTPAPCCCGIPYYRRLPIRGFKNSLFTVRFTVINLSVLEKLAISHQEIDRNVLIENGVVKPSVGLIKILGNGALTKPIKVIADEFSESAKRKIESVGGSVVKTLMGMDPLNETDDVTSPSDDVPPVASGLDVKVLTELPAKQKTKKSAAKVTKE
jgi:large subunit ribosomal protein L15